MTDSHHTKPIRWWPALVGVALSIVALLMIWGIDTPDRQKQVLISMPVLALGFLFFALWFFGMGRFGTRIRLWGLLGLVLLLGLMVSLFRIRGFTGDLMPNLEWRQATESFVPDDTPERLDTVVDYPQFLGPHRNATLTGIALEADWEQHPPRLLWRKPVGEGWSAFAVSGRFAVTQEQRGDLETVVCYDLLTGAEKWRHQDAARYENAMAGIGPRATPTVSGDRVYTFGATGILNCLDLKTGRRIWSCDTVKETGARVNDWGMSGSPLVLDNRVVVSPGGPNGRSLMAYRKGNGAVVWGGGDAPAGYSSPVLATLAGTEQILIFNRKQVAGHDPISGTLLWQSPWPGGTQHVAQPIALAGDRVFVSTGYGIGCQLLEIARHGPTSFSAKVVWENTHLKAKFTNVVSKGGYLYGLDDGILVCLDLSDGRRKWKGGRYGHGQLILVDDLLLIQTEPGDVVLVEASPEGHRERARFAALNGRTWNNPTFAAPYLLVRNDREAACYEVALKTP